MNFWIVGIDGCELMYSVAMVDEYVGLWLPFGLLVLTVGNFVASAVVTVVIDIIVVLQSRTFSPSSICWRLTPGCSWACTFSFGCLSS